MKDVNSRNLRSPHLTVALLGLLTVNAHAEDLVARCADDPAFHQQDFALGSWDVYSADKKVAEARLETSLNGCAIRET